MQELRLWCHENCVSEWSPWSPCSSRCGHGKMERTREPTNSPWCELDGFQCTQSKLQRGDCNTGCPFGGLPSNQACTGCPTGKTGVCCETEVFCSYPSRPSNGKVDGTWPAKPESLAEFTCNMGFNLDGDDVAVCRNNGSWSNSKPQCQPIQCLTPKRNPKVLILNYNPDGYAFGEQVVYDCEDGYKLQGEKTRTCRRGVTGNGVWTGYDNQCKAVNCPVPVIPQNGDIKDSKTSFKFGDIIRFECDQGYKLIGSDNLQCLASGSWFGNQPTCEAITCEAPFTPRNGQVRIRKSGTAAYALFECDEGYRLEPDVSTLFCNDQGNWNITEPKCIAASCGDPGSPTNGYRDGGVFTFGNEVNFHCERGYELTAGSEKMECQSNGQWSGSLPTCSACALGSYMEDKSCKICPLHTFTASEASTSIVQCLCDTDNGYVGPPGGPCPQVRCTELDAPENGAVTDCGNKVAASCNFTCNDGFVVERGSTRRTCQNTGEWDGTSPFCVPCKLNTFKSGERTCSPCPLQSHTNQTGQMKTGCVCDKGYEGPPGGPCTDIDECLVNDGKGQCEDTCENNAGGFKCRCTIPGYKINPQDHLSCIVEEQCRNLTKDEAPENGGLVCHWYREENSQHCSTKCNPGYELPSRTNDYETCGPSTGYTWSYQVVDPTEILPPCIEEFFPGFQLEGGSAYFAAACEDLTEDQKIAAKEEFAKTLNDNGVCIKRNTKLCDIKDMGIICGRTTRRRRRRGVDVLEHSVDFKFNVASDKLIDNEKDCNEDICRLIRLPLKHCKKYCVRAYKRFIEAGVRNAKRVLTEIYSNTNKLQNLKFEIDNVRFVPEKDSFLGTDVKKQCPEGMGVVSDQCLPCEAGTYLDVELNECVVCPKNTYQNKVRQYSCIPCTSMGPGFFTSANTSTVCEICPEGWWGDNCLKQCSCVHGACSPFTGECICQTGWEGSLCEKDLNSCVPGACHPGVTCIDEPPPGTGFSCGPCPSGFHGDGYTCTAIKRKKRSLGHMAFEL